MNQVVIHGQNLRRLEIAMQRMELLGGSKALWDFHNTRITIIEENV